VAVTVAVIVTAMALIVTVATTAFNVTLPKQALGFAIALILGAAAVLPLGALIAALAPTGRIASAAGTLVFFPMMFFAGLWIPRALMTPTLRHISDYTPLGATVAAVQETMRGQWPATTHLVVLAAYAIVFSFAAARLFRWE
jgi:ABC-2 type transport system permease protein